MQISDSTHSLEEIPSAAHIPMLAVPKQQQESSPRASSQKSADEIETTKSLDIEIISSPIGDSSSINRAAYRANPLMIPYGKNIMCRNSNGHGTRAYELAF